MRCLTNLRWLLIKCRNFLNVLKMIKTLACTTHSINSVTAKLKIETLENLGNFMFYCQIFVMSHKKYGDLNFAKESRKQKCFSETLQCSANVITMPVKWFSFKLLIYIHVPPSLDIYLYIIVSIYDIYILINLISTGLGSSLPPSELLLFIS